MDTNETLQINGKTITARDKPRGEFGVYRSYEVDDQSFALLEDATAYANAGKPVKAAAKSKPKQEKPVMPDPEPTPEPTPEPQPEPTPEPAPAE